MVLSFIKSMFYIIKNKISFLKNTVFTTYLNSFQLKNNIKTLNQKSRNRYIV